MNNSPTIFSVTLLLILFAIGCHLKTKSPGSNPPNILLINVDDLGYMDTELYGSHDIKTPHILKLAAQGMTFTQAYASAANCAPSRACMLSGQYSPRHGIYTVGSSERGKSKDRKLIPTLNTTTLPDSVVTLADELQKAGYRTVAIGKWHLGADPTTQGFDVNIGGTHSGHPKSYFSPYKNPNLIDGPEGEYLTDRLTREAIAQMSVGDHPFFLYLPYFAVHTPLQGKKSLVQKYLNRGLPKKTAEYAAMVENMDTNLGRLFNALDSLKLRKNTLILFTSDNGGIAAIHSQHPLRGGKGSYYEGGTRVPLIISWPGHIKPRSVSDLPVSNIDFYPTLLAVINHKQTTEKILDGIDISPEWTGHPLPRERSLYWHFPIYLQAYSGARDDSRDDLFRTRPGSSLRQGKWKLHQYFEDNPTTAFELYNLETDPGERTNLFDSRPDIAKKLKDRLLDWREEVSAPVPVKRNPEFETK
ncbi:sulfatase [Membranicola marinus]|uniref:Sulfatase n=1 Tax=Membranihabitans marinus TaxID=1227546 RepID=A0A953L8G0_9BACT|nr:sulfatase [Membranihabitans marinus]MBY5957645.1 sulfatase [Membranihabitans marinus]